MLTIVILVAGLTIVIGGILLFRLHAFVALVLAGLLVAACTPSRLVTRSAQLEASVNRIVIDDEAMLVLADEPLEDWQDLVVAEDPDEGAPLKRFAHLTEEVPLTEWKRPARIATARGQSPEESSDSSEKPTQACYRYVLDEGQTLPKHDNVVLHVLSREAHVDAQASGKQSFMSRLTAALGSYCGKLAILIVAASIIGRCLLDSGAADRIVRSALNTVGEKNAPTAFVLSGFTLSIPVFFDTVFYLMIPLGKAMRLRTGGNYLLYVLAIVAGGSIAHSLVPPTPGPLFIAEAFNVSLAAMIVGGCIVGLFCSFTGMLYAVWANRRFVLELPEDDTAATTAPQTGIDSTQKALQPDDAATVPNAPGLVASLTPILLPVLLITLGALISKVESPDVPETPRWLLAGMEVPQSLARTLKMAGEKNFALLLSAVFAVLMYVQAKRPSKDEFAKAMQDAVSSAGTIILVTAAGGAFGRMMKQTSVAELLQGLPGTSPVMVVVAAFLVTMAVRTAQGSSTVAMITAAGIFGGLVTSGAAGVDPLYVALAVGCGSKPIAWMNDSGFWVITRMSGMTEKEGLTYVTPMTALAGTAGLAAVILGVLLFP